MNIYSIDGYWKDDGTEFSNYLVTDTDGIEDLPERFNEDDIFFFGLSEKDIKENIEDATKLRFKTCHDFVITNYRREATA